MASRPLMRDFDGLANERFYDSEPPGSELDDHSFRHYPGRCVVVATIATFESYHANAHADRFRKQIAECQEQATKTVSQPDKDV
jgi:hypothetical protein